MILTALVFLIILTVLVLIHEAGHFFVAKKLGIKVEEFGFGLPPRAFGIKRGETMYSVNWLPIGGFVKLYGEDEAGGGKIRIKDQRLRIKDTERAFFAKTPMERASVVVAGVVMNAILASVIFYIFLGISGFTVELPLLGDHKFFFVNQQNVSDIIVGSVAKDSPAEKAGIQPVSKITKINGQKVSDTRVFIDIINKNRGKEVSISWQDVKTNKNFTKTVVPRISPPKNEGALGVGFSTIQTAVLTYKTIPQKLFSGIVHPVNLLLYNFDVMGKLIGYSIKEKTAAPLSGSVSGPVGIFSVVGNIVQIPDVKQRLLQVLNLAGILSISLAFFNILPIPALDGGRLFFILIEAVSGRRVPQKFESYVHTVGMVVLLMLLALITFQDIGRLFTK